MRKCFACGIALALACAGAPGQDIGIAPVALGDGPYFFDTAEQHGIRVDVVVRGLAHPFSLALLPNGDALIVERGAQLRVVRDATGTTARLAEAAVPGAPEVGRFRGAGLHDIALHPQFENNQLVYFTYNRPGQPNPSAAPAERPPTALTLARARFDGTRLLAGEDLFVGEDIPGGSGSRIAFGPDDTVYLTSGAPFSDDAQQIDNVYGKVLRVRADGGIPPDNPFANARGARREIYSLGHRDQLGLTVHESGVVLAAEHGPNGGDEVNLILPGRNYGWPDYSFGRSYEGPRISEVPLGPDIVQPLALWIPS
ncbi:MAG: PQQ-dependent sugar dehydrogenase, partial [Gammaproteobacteria bacterium]